MTFFVKGTVYHAVVEHMGQGFHVSAFSIFLLSEIAGFVVGVEFIEEAKPRALHKQPILECTIKSRCEKMAACLCRSHKYSYFFDGGEP